MMIYYKVTPHRRDLDLPLFIILSIVAALVFRYGWPPSTFISRRKLCPALPDSILDVHYAVAYSSKVISPKWQLVYSLNPMAGWSTVFAGRCSVHRLDPICNWLVSVALLCLFW